MAKRKVESQIWQFNSQPLKVGNCLDFCACRWRATYHWKYFEKGYNFALNLISIGGLQTKLWAPKVAGVPTLGNSRFPLGSPGTKCHLDDGPVASHKVYYKGEGGGFPKSRLWWVLWVRIRLWLVLTPKVLQQCTNQLIVWFCAGPCEWLSAWHSS
jgi:hypothetical protein